MNMREIINAVVGQSVHQSVITESMTLRQIRAQKESFVNEWDVWGCDDEYEAESRFDETMETFAALPSTFLVYRGMAVSQKWLDDIQKGDTPALGKHWTYDKDAARTDLNGHDHALFRDPEDRKNLIVVTLVAKVRKSSIDWDATMSQNMCYPDEAEITIELPVFLGKVITPRGVIKTNRTFPTTI